MTAINARGLRKQYGQRVALDGVDLAIEAGRIVGVLGPNGAGKTTLLEAILGLVPCAGELAVLGRDPWRERDRLLADVAFIADVAVLPRFLRVDQALAFVEGVHPRFRRDRAEQLLLRSAIPPRAVVRELSKGMVTQLHLALVLAIDARLLVLDEPTLGLDLLFRKKFYDSLLADYCDRPRTVLVATHQVEEVQDVLTDVVLLDRGRVVLAADLEQVAARFHELLADPARVAAARALAPRRERQVLGRSRFLFDGIARDQLVGLGEVRTPSLAELFVGLLGEPAASPSPAVSAELAGGGR
jgi:ABC-2 type transport system ATP-binding protein